MKSELKLKTFEIEPSTYPKLMKHKDGSFVILATSQDGNSITGMVINTIDQCLNKVGDYSVNWGAEYFTDLPRYESVILSNN